jgi:hemerythrin
MEHLVWTNDLNTGIDVIDGQHRRIVEYINQLQDARLKHDSTAIGEVIEATVDYTLSHFGFEETLMEDAGYEFVRPHKKVHELFVKRVAEFQLRFKAGEDVAEELNHLLVRWLFSHIRNDDAAYVKAVKSKMQVLTEEKQQGGWLSRSVGKFFRGA